MIDWAVATKQKVIQILPINDTTNTYTRKDSYPYNAISIYALHPIYLGLKQYPLKDENVYASCMAEPTALNALPQVGYEQVFRCKMAYIDTLFLERGADVLASADFALFYGQNKDWLFPYACFSYLRDRYKTADIRCWENFVVYDKQLLENLLTSDLYVRLSIDKIYFIQYLLHTQLAEVKAYAHSRGVVLKGDIPIGINRNSVEAWTEPQLFNMDTQTGDPPDDFSVNGQNWGFPTYNWAEMSKDNYLWWVKRFRKMADYFAEHLLGESKMDEVDIVDINREQTF